MLGTRDVEVLHLNSNKRQISSRQSPRRIEMKTLALLAISALLAVSCVCAAQDKAFYLKSGDIVLFYGDSITEQRLYSVIVETYVATHYPDRDVTFVNSGWGGDKVSGGGGGPIDTRLKRDVFPYRPTVITIMLGMNDGNYTTETQENDEKYFSGYRHIIDSLRSNLPQARIAAIEPSPYDDITRPPTFPVSGDSLYNEVMRSFGKWIASYAKQSGLDVVDANATVVNALIQAHVSDPENAKSIIPDHVHPSFGGHLLMAGELLKAWGARPVVTGVAIDASHPAVKLESAEFATVSNLSNSGT